MRAKELILQEIPCFVDLGDPSIQTEDDLKKKGHQMCENFKECEANPQYRCVMNMGVEVARSVINFYAIYNKNAIKKEMEIFKESASLPPKCPGYYDTQEHGFRVLTDTGEICRRVGECAAQVLSLRPDELIFRSAEET